MKKRRFEETKTTDFTKKDLPQTRKQIFLDLIKTQKRQMVSLSMLLFVFLLPLVVDIVIFNMFILNVSFNEPSYQSLVFSLFFYMMIIAIPCSMVAFVGLSGLAHVSKKIAWQESIMSGPEFFAGIKKNWKHALFFGLIWGISFFIFVVGILFMLRTQSMVSQPWLNSIGIGLCIVQFLVLSIVSVYALTYDCYYVNSFRQVLKNSFIFFTAKFFKNLLFFLLTFGLVAGLILIELLVGSMVVDFIVQIVIIIVIAFLSSYMMIAWTLLSHEAFDQYINQFNYPEYYKKGLYISEEPKEK